MKALDAVLAVALRTMQTASGPKRCTVSGNALHSRALVAWRVRNFCRLTTWVEGLCQAIQNPAPRAEWKSLIYEGH
jgi:hypothetical protein